MKITVKTIIAATASLVACGASNAALVSQFGILDLTANGGINPNTGAAWADGDQYRLAFHTDGGTPATSNDPAFYDNFATTQAQQNAALATSSGWTAHLYVHTDGSLPAGSSPVSSPRDRAGTADIAGGSGVGGAGVPMFAMDGTTAIARNNADMYDGWSNPFDSNSVVRLTGAQTGGQAVHYSPFLDQFASGDTGVVHGADVWTGGFGAQVNPAGDTTDEVRTSIGSSNANNAGRTWNRFQRNNVDSNSVYAISPLLTVTDAVPEPSSVLLGGLGCLFLLRRSRR
ncbi:MAG: PEP-CTERM sorting domain-containing protein [Verrucomicrobiaceae bacterium]|nr:PEP-CTERM sorting domain-containing protein [Verrucomicrobiaceae bacterium]